MATYKQPPEHLITNVLPVLYNFARYGRRFEMSYADAQALGELYAAFTGRTVTPYPLASRR
jgi:hypothetical protein